MVGYKIYDIKLTGGVTGDVCLVFPAKTLLLSISICYGQWKIILLRSQKDFILISVTVFCSIRNMTGFLLYGQKSNCGLTGNFCFMFPAKAFFSLLICYW